MKFVSLDDFLDDVAPEVPGCPTFTIQDRIRWAATEFCKNSGVSVETTDSIDLEANEEELSLPTPSGDVRVWQVLWMKTDSGPVLELDRRSMNERGIQWDGLTGDYPLSYVRKSNEVVQLIPKPTVDRVGALTLHCSYIPTRDADRLDAVLLDEWREAIVCGALSKLLNMSKEDWYDPSEARERGMMFSIYQSEARALADKDFSVGEQHVRMNPFA